MSCYSARRENDRQAHSTFAFGLLFATAHFVNLVGSSPVPRMVMCEFVGKIFYGDMDPARTNTPARSGSEVCRPRRGPPPTC